MDFETWRTYLEKFGPPKPIIDELESLVYEVEEWPTIKWEDWRKECIRIASRLCYYAGKFLAHSISERWKSKP